MAEELRHISESSIVQSPVVLVTGAGASAPFGLPTMRAFMDVLENELWPDVSKLGAPYKLREPNDPGRDLEMVLAGLRRAIHACEEVQQTMLLKEDPDPELGSAIRRLGMKGQDLQIIDGRIKDHIFTTYSVRPNASQVVEVFGKLIEGIRAAYPEQRSIPVFTFNYDRVVEVYAAQAGLPLEDGFDRQYDATIWNPTRYQSYEPPEDRPGLVLFKLHGSVDWRRRGEDIERINIQERQLAGLQEVLIYPGYHDESTQGEPSRTAYAFLRECIRHTQMVLVVGYSFRDEPFRRVVKEGFQAAEFRPAQLLVVDPAYSDAWTKDLLTYGFYVVDNIPKSLENIRADELVEPLYARG